MKTLIAFWLVAVFAGLGVAVGADDKDTKKDSVIAFTGAKVITVSGRIHRRGTVVVRGKLIEAVGEDVVVPEGARVVDCRGKVIMPGFVAVASSGLGVASRFRFSVGADGHICEHHPGAEHGPECTCACGHLQDIVRLRDPLVNPLNFQTLDEPSPAARAAAMAVHVGGRAVPGGFGVSGVRLLYPESFEGAARDRFDHHSRSLVFALAAGITSAYSSGGGGSRRGAPTTGGDAVTMKMARGDLDGMFLAAGRFIILNYTSMSASARFNLREELEGTRRYLREQADYEKAKANHDKARARYKADKKAGKKVEAPTSPKKPKRPAGAARWLPVFEGKKWVRAYANTITEIRNALAHARRYKMKMVLEGAIEAWAVAGEVAEVGAFVVLDPRRRAEKTVVPRRGAFYRHGSSAEATGILERAGVRVAVISPQTSISLRGIPGRDLLTFALDAAFAVRGGMTRAESYRCITLTAAEILGVDDRIGSLEAGKDADLLVLDGDPFDHKTFVESAYVNGRLVYEHDKEPLFDYVKRGRVVKPIPTTPKKATAGQPKNISN